MPVHAKIAFTDLTVRGLKEGFYIDAKTPRFAIRVGKHKRTWIALQGPRCDKKTLGHYPQLSLSEARRKALVAIGSPYIPSTAPPFPEALNLFLAQTHWKARSYYQISRTLRKYFQWTKTLDKITHNDVASVIHEIKATSEAAHALKDIKTFFSWCTPRYIVHSPCDGLKSPHKYVPRDRLLTDEEVKRIWKAADEMGPYGLQVKRLLVTGQRCNQIFRFKKEWVNTEKKIITFPPAVMKGNKQHVIPYGPLFATLLDDFPVITNQGRQKGELDRVASVTGYTLHDARRYFSSTHAKLHTPIDVTEALLSHISGSRSDIQRIYDLYDRLPEMEKAVAAYENFLIGLVVG